MLGHTDANMGLYYLGLHAWMWGGDSETWVRTFSAVCFVATIPVVALLGRRLFGDAAGLLAGLLFTGSTFVVLYGQDARGYELALLLATISTLLFVAGCEGDARSRALIGYCVVSVLAVYANLFTALVLLVHAGSLVAHPARNRLLRRFAIPYAAIVAATLPLAVFMLASGTGQLSWLSRPTPGALGGTAKAFLGFHYTPLAVLAGAIVAIGVVGLWRGAVPTGTATAPRVWRFALVAGWLVVPPLALFIVSQGKPFYLNRYLIAIAPAVAILGALGLIGLARRSRPLAVAAASLLLVLFVAARADLPPIDNEDLRAAAATVTREDRPGDAIAYAPAYARVGMDWYLEQEAGDSSGLPADFTVAPDGGARQVGDLYARELSSAQVADRLPTYDRVWVASYPDSTWHPTPEPFLDSGIPILRDSYRVVRSADFGNLRLTLYQRVR